MKESRFFVNNSTVNQNNIQIDNHKYYFMYLAASAVYCNKKDNIFHLNRFNNYFNTLGMFNRSI
jgi:hypothetical protein